MKYQLKPTEAIQWPGYWTQEAKDFAGNSLRETEPRDGIGVVGYYLSTPNGDKWLHKRDYIVKNYEGTVFHFEEIEFEKIYEKLGN